MSTWTPTTAPPLMRHDWVPPIDADEPLSERAVLALEAALHQRRDQARQLRAPQPMGLCVAAPKRAQHAPSDADSRHLRDDDDHHMHDVQSDAMSASDFGALSHTSSMHEDAALRHGHEQQLATHHHGRHQQQQQQQQQQGEEGEEEEGEEEEEEEEGEGDDDHYEHDDDDDDDDLARYL